MPAALTWSEERGRAAVEHLPPKQPTRTEEETMTHHKLSPTCTRTDRTWTDDDGKTHVAHTWHRTTKTRTPARR